MTNENNKIKNINKKYDTQMTLNKNKNTELLNKLKKYENEIKLLKLNNNKLIEQKNKINLDFINFKEMIINKNNANKKSVE